MRKLLVTKYLPAICIGSAFLIAGWGQQRPATPPSEQPIRRNLAADRPTQSDPDLERRIKWWREARFGLFIHWGLYAVPAGEWRGQAISGFGEWIMNLAKIPVADYERLATQFNPVKFNAEQWVQMAKDAGMKYIVITSKHHDGFAMYGSKVSRYNIVDATPFGRDPLKELAAACQKAGLRLCFYYSHAQDWHEPDGAGNSWDFPPNPQKNFANYFESKAIPQVRELLTNYGPLGVIWFDTPQLVTREQATRLRNVALSLQPDILVSGRIGQIPADFDEATDNQLAVGVAARDWETPCTMNDTWGFKKNDQNWKPVSVLIQQLVRVASKGGNYLLNVGPTAEGEIPQPSVERLAEIGKWLKVNGDSVRGTSPNPFPYNLEWGYMTVVPNRLYLHVVQWPGNSLTIYGIKNKVQNAWLLADPTRRRLAVKQESKPPLNYYSTRISLPAAAPDRYDSVVVLEIGSAPDVVKTLSQQPNGGVSLHTYLADLHKATNESRLTLDDMGTVRGWFDVNDWVSWDFNTFQPGTYDVTVVTSVRARLTGTAPPAWQGGQKVLCEVAGLQVRGTLADNGRLSDAADPMASYVLSKIGQVTIDKPGPQKLVLKTEDAEVQKTLGLSLHGVKLVPVK
jgi:alpha-L-fucosidase